MAELGCANTLKTLVSCRLFSGVFMRLTPYCRQCHVAIWTSISGPFPDHGSFPFPVASLSAVTCGVGTPGSLAQRTLDCGDDS